MSWLIPGHIVWPYHLQCSCGLWRDSDWNPQLYKNLLYLHEFLFFPNLPSISYSQFHIKDRNLTPVYTRLGSRNVNLKLNKHWPCIMHRFSCGAHMHLEQCLWGCSEFHYISSQDVFLTESRSRGFPSGTTGLNFCLGHPRDQAGGFLSMFSSEALWLCKREGMKPRKVGGVAVCTLCLWNLPSF